MRGLPGYAVYWISLGADRLPRGSTLEQLPANVAGDLVIRTQPGPDNEVRLEGWIMSTKALPKD